MAVVQRLVRHSQHVVDDTWGPKFLFLFVNLSFVIYYTFQVRKWLVEEQKVLLHQAFLDLVAARRGKIVFVTVKVSAHVGRVTL